MLGKANITWLLLQNGADPNEKYRGSYVLTKATAYRRPNVAVAEILLAYGAKVITDERRKSDLFLAV